MWTVRKLCKVSEKPASTLGFSTLDVVSKEPHPIEIMRISHSRTISSDYVCLEADSLPGIFHGIRYTGI